jgi:hypothetical protein
LYAAEVAYCVKHGIPHSRWLADWSDEDRATVIAWQAREAGRCSGCGTFPTDWLDEHGRAALDRPMVAHTWTCEGCRELVLARSGLKARYGEDHDIAHAALRPSRPTDDDDDDGWWVDAGA